MGILFMNYEGRMMKTVFRIGALLVMFISGMGAVTNALAQEEVRQVIERNNGHVLNMGNPTTTLEELFLHIIRESEEHPGRRLRGVAKD